MPEQNRVTPLGDVVAVAARGRWMGNRGCLHDDRRRIVRHHAGKRWIICETDFRGRHMEQWRPGQYTVLYFHDEAVALAAGHRPCYQCRYRSYQAFFAAIGSRERADDLDARLHVERWDGRGHPLHRMPWAAVPAGAFVVVDGVPSLVTDDAAVPWTTAGYDASSARARPRAGDATLVTPPLICQALTGGYVPQVSW